MNDDDKPERATGGPIDPGRNYWIGENGPPPFLLPLGWEQYESGTRRAEAIRKAWGDHPGFKQWLESPDYQLHIADGKGGWTQAWPPPKPPKPAWWEYRWPPFVLAVIALITSIAALVIGG